MEFNTDTIFAILNFLRENDAYDLLSFYYSEIPGEYSDQQIALHLEYCRDKDYVKGQFSADKIMALAQLTPTGLQYLQSMDNMTTQPEIPKAKAIDLLTTSVDAIPQLKQLSTKSPEFIEWRRDTEVCILHIFGDKGRHLEDFTSIDYHPGIIPPDGNTPETLHLSYLSGLDKAESVLKSMIREINIFRVKDDQKLVPSDSPPPVEISKSTTNSVFQENHFTLNENLVFMLSPFGEPFDTIFTNHIKPTVEDNPGLRCIRADNIYDNQPVIEDIWRYTNEAKIVIAELTGKNANVFYETGLAHAIGKEVILITQSMNDVPFDLRHWRHIVYKNTPEGIDEFKSKLTNTISSILSRTIPPRPSS